MRSRRRARFFSRSRLRHMTYSRAIIKAKPVSADLSFGVVDEAMYSIYPDNSGDIVKRLYPDRYVYAPYDSSLQYYFSGQRREQVADAG